MAELKEVGLPPGTATVPERVERFIEEGLARGKAVRCFDWIPSNYRAVYATLAELPAGRFCEWGSGMGIVTGMAEMLGHQAHGIEIEEQLVAASQKLLADFGLSARIAHQSYFDPTPPADLYFVYCWPGQIQSVEQHFLETAPQEAKLLILHGQEDIRCLQKCG